MTDPSVTGHRIQVLVDAVEHWQCTCGGWEFRCDYQLDANEMTAVRDLHAEHAERNGR